MGNKRNSEGRSSGCVWWRWIIRRNELHNISKCNKRQCIIERCNGGDVVLQQCGEGGKFQYEFDVGEVCRVGVGCLEGIAAAADGE